jgi:hypothetical protein
MSVDTMKSNLARVLAELLDLALADDWNGDAPSMALLWEVPDDPDGVRIAVKRLEAGVEEEMALVADGDPYLAVAHSTVTRRPPPELRPGRGGVPVRVTVAVDHASQAGVLRHRNGSTEWFGGVDLPVVNVVRSLLRFEPARAA